MRAALLLVALVLVAGCTGGPAATPTETASPSPTPDPTPGTATETPTTVAYSDLSQRDQAVVRAAVNGTVRFLPDSPHVPETRFGPDAVDAFRDAEYVRYDGTRYAVSLTQGDLYATYGVETEVAEPEPSATVVDAANLSEREREVVAAALNGGYYTELGADRPPMPDAEYVRYEGETYRLLLVVGDYWTWELRLSPA
ncbi:hypothetical protein [Halosegnis longus]|uniref:DUF7979 domain-containing protein n=1 Tax=Halosegnis longus TaxID=2216012 RepID=A0AAJ4UVB0_9EURY|nr:hypothetical protein [Halosegnis longus]RNJ25734.1 hypothetical protein Nmn1133_02865 [Salella cibi]